MDLLPPSNLKRNEAFSYETLLLFYLNIFSHIENNHNHWLTIREFQISLEK